MQALESQLAEQDATSRESDAKIHVMRTKLAIAEKKTAAAKADAAELRASAKAAERQELASGGALVAAAEAKFRQAERQWEVLLLDGEGKLAAAEAVRVQQLSCRLSFAAFVQRRLLVFSAFRSLTMLCAITTWTILQ